jgi:hypothetical protein
MTSSSSSSSSSAKVPSGLLFFFFSFFHRRAAQGQRPVVRPCRLAWAGQTQARQDPGPPGPRSTPNSPPQRATGKKKKKKRRATRKPRDAIHSGAPLIIPPLVGRQQASLRGPAANPVRVSLKTGAIDSTNSRPSKAPKTHPLKAFLK